MANKYTLRDAAKMLGTGQNRLTRQLRELGILDHQNLPRQSDLARGRFHVELKINQRNPTWNDGRGQLYHKTLVTQRGLIWLAGMLGAQILQSDDKEQAA